MITKFCLRAEIDDIAEQFGATKVIGMANGRSSVAPTETVSIVMNDVHHVRIVRESRWGLFPFWATDSVNVDYARLPDKPFLHRMLKGQRCVIPCSGFYGERHIAEEKHPQAMYTNVPDRPLLGVAGIFDCWKYADGTEACAFTMLTAASSGKMSVWQPRIPVFLDEDGIEDWLNPKLKEAASLRRHLYGMEGYMLHSSPVSDAAALLP